MEVSVDQPVAFIAVRLNDVAPGGASTRVTYGLLNLTHRDSHDHPRPLDPGKRCLIKVTLNDVAYAFPPRHKLRLAISTSYWPIVWPAPQPVTVSLFTGESFVDLPVRPPDLRDSALRPFELPERAPQKPPSFGPLLSSGSSSGTAPPTRPSTPSLAVTATLDGAKLTRIKAIGLDVGHMMLKDFRISEEDPEMARAEVIQKTWFRRGGGDLRRDTHSLRLELRRFHTPG